MSPERGADRDWIQEAFRIAPAIAAAPGSDSARAALRNAWALEAGLTPLTTRFVCIYD